MLAVPLHISMPEDSDKGTVRITNVTGTPVTEPPAFVIHYDCITLTVTPAEDYMLLPNGVSVTWTDEEEREHSVELEKGDEENEWLFMMPAHDVSVSAVFITDFSEAPDFILPANIGRIEANAFEWIASMTAVDAQNCSYIGAEAFKNCTGLEQIRLPKECEIEEDEFENCGTVCVFAPAGGKTEEFCNQETNRCVLIPIEDTEQNN